jgi:transposase
MARKMQIEWKHDVEQLELAYRNAKSIQDRQRLQALKLIRQGKTMKDAAEIVGVHYRTVQTWIAWYRQGSMENILSRKHGGSRIRQRRLTAEQEAALKQKADAGEISRIEDGVVWARETYQVNYTYWGMRHVFGRLKLKLKVPRPRNPKASETEQVAWKKGG